jgi:glycosyltransferase involved in cell wall biosynthesis
MKSSTLTYFALVDVDKAPGVSKKIDDTIKVAQSIGLKANSMVYKTSFNGVLVFFEKLVLCRSDIIFIRFSDLVFPLVFFIMVYLRVRGLYIIIDVPSPRITGLKEMDILISSTIKRSARKLLTYLSASWVLMPAHRIIQYASEGVWFSLGIKNKTLKIGNGILMDSSIPLTKACWPSDNLNLIAVAQLANWHGYDRLLNALSKIKDQNLAYKVNLTIVGEGEALAGLKNLANELKLDNVKFTGRLLGKELDKEFEQAHIGVSSLGLSRKGLTEASELKTREYMSRGLSVIAGGEDPDFVNDCPFRYVVANDESVSGLVDLIAGFGKQALPNPVDVRAYAQKKLSLEGKLMKIIEFM